MKLKVTGYTGPHPDFSDSIEFDGDLEQALAEYGPCGDNREKLKDALLDSSCPTDYLDVFDECGFERREDLDRKGEIVAVAEAWGCENCSEQGINEWTDGCNDEPHGGYMLVFEW